MIITGRTPGEQTCWSEPWTGFSARTGKNPANVGTIEPLWNLFDLTREGRPANWHEQFSY